MSDVSVLLPSSSDVFELALASGMSDDLPIPYAEIMDPYRTPVRFLPWLAAHHSVDLWFDDWPDDRKREMIAQCAGVSTIYPASPLAALKGTLAGLKRYLAFVDAEIVDRIAHPSRFTFGRAVI
ncbi:MAG: phage tail protein I, partial [Agrobacterium vaccinii]